MTRLSRSLESDPKKSWRKITNFVKPKGPCSYPTLRLGNKTARTNPEKAQLFAESVERNFGIESHLFSKSQFDRINKFVEAHSYHFTPLDSLHGNTTDKFELTPRGNSFGFEGDNGKSDSFVEYASDVNDNQRALRSDINLLSDSMAKIQLRKGYCYQFQKTGACTKVNCKFMHVNSNLSYLN